MKTSTSTLPEGTNSTLEPLRRGPAALVPPAPAVSFRIELGAMCRPIAEQLPGLLSKEDAKHLQLDNEAITRLYIRGLIPQRATDNARQRLLKKIQAAVTKHCKALRPASPV